jgi:hypothetical protein
MEIKSKFQDTAYLIDFDDWCKKVVYQIGGYYECTN